MNQVLMTIVLCGLLILFIVSPFAALASLMLILLAATLFWTVVTVVQVLLSGSDANARSRSHLEQNDEALDS